MTTTLVTAPNVTAPKVRGFALYVGASEAELLAADTSITSLVNELKQRLKQLAPNATSYASLALSPEQAGGSDIDVVRLALGEPVARAAAKPRSQAPVAEPEADGCITIDLDRRRVLLGTAPTPLTFREFELLQLFVEREGETVTRGDIIDALYANVPAAEVPGARTIDVHIRRLRIKLGSHGTIIRTVHGAGYRFDRHAGVRVISVY